MDCGGGTTVVPDPVRPTYGVRSLCLSALEIPAGVVLTHDGSSPPPLVVIVDGSARIEGAIDFDGLDGGGAPGESGGWSGTIAGGMGATFLSSAQDGRSSTAGGGGGGGGGTGYLVVRASYLDQDADGIPDGEDTCPTVPGMCFTIGDIRTGLVPEGTSVVLENVVVTAIDAGGAGQSIWVQDANPAITEHGGIQLFFGAAALPAVSIGDLASVTGVYGEFFGVSQLTSPAATATASGWAVQPILVANPADIATGGGRAEALEGMLVRVENVTVTAAPDASGEFVVTGGLRVDDLIYSAG